jgi:hypothetical protein
MPEDDENETLRGLHAKLYVADAGWDARLWTGSANATHAAFSGNIEFMVELAGKKSFCGIDRVLDASDDSTGLKDLLQRYEPPGEPAERDETQSLHSSAGGRTGPRFSLLQEGYGISASRGRTGVGGGNPRASRKPALHHHAPGHGDAARGVM